MPIFTLKGSAHLISGILSESLIALGHQPGPLGGLWRITSGLPNCPDLFKDEASVELTIYSSTIGSTVWLAATVGLAWAPDVWLLSACGRDRCCSVSQSIWPVVQGHAISVSATRNVCGISSQVHQLSSCYHV